MPRETLAVEGFEDVVVNRVGGRLGSVVVVHDSRLGPALGGVRMRRYDSDEAAVAECQSLARAMTLKAAAAGLDLGGGWSVLLGDPDTEKTEAGLRAHGELIGSLDGRFIPVNDIGTDQADIAVIGKETAPVCAQGDPSPWTALGVAYGIEACLRRLGQDSLTGVHVAIQGVGNVGRSLARLLAAAGARLTVADLRPERTETLRADPELGDRVDVVSPDEIVGLDCDVLAPCALGGIVRDETLGALRCRAIAGGANDVVNRAEHAQVLLDRGIIYAPDYCVNAGGLIYLQERLRGGTEMHARAKVAGIGDVIAEILQESYLRGIPTTIAAKKRATTRLESASQSDFR